MAFLIFIGLGETVKARSLKEGAWGGKISGGGPPEMACPAAADFRRAFQEGPSLGLPSFGIGNL